MMRNKRLLLPLALGLALATRGILLILLSHSPSFAGTSLTYAESAHLLVAGHGYASGSGDTLQRLQTARGRLLDPEDFPPYPDSVAVAPTMFRQPGYSFLLAGSFALFGRERYIYLQIVQVLVDALAATLLVFWIGRHFFGPTVGAGAALLYAVSPLARIAVYPLPDAWMSVVALASLACVLKHAATGSLRWLVLAGLCLGLGANLRQEIALLLVPAYGVAAVVASRRLARGVLVVLVTGSVAALCLAPWMIRNYRQFGTTRSAMVQTGGLMWEGIGAYPNRLGAQASDSVLYAYQTAQGYEPMTPEADRFIRGEIRRYVRDYPGEAAGILLRQIVRTTVLQGGRWDLFGGKSAREAVSTNPRAVVSRAFLLFYRVGLFLAVVVGLRRGSRRWPVTAFLLAVPLAFMIPHWLIVLEPRHILVATGPLTVFAAVALWGARPGWTAPGPGLPGTKETS
jgi:4-amino-4-deoxy-L-arabinose transferase-like glycosyltransferase